MERRREPQEHSGIRTDSAGMRNDGLLGLALQAHAARPATSDPAWNQAAHTSSIHVATGPVHQPSDLPMLTPVNETPQVQPPKPAAPWPFRGARHARDRNYASALTSRVGRGRGRGRGRRRRRRRPCAALATAPCGKAVRAQALRCQPGTTGASDMGVAVCRDATFLAVMYYPP